MLRSLLKYLSTHPSMALEVSLQMVPTSSPTGAKLYSTRAPSKLSLRPVVETPVDSENSPGYRHSNCCMFQQWMASTRALSESLPVGTICRRLSPVIRCISRTAATRFPSDQSTLHDASCIYSADIVWIARPLWFARQALFAACQYVRMSVGIIRCAMKSTSR